MTTMLVVDDDRAIRALVCAVLEVHGYEVCGEAADGQCALDHLRAHPQRHVILLDLEMPTMNGVQTLEALTSDPFVSWSHSVIVMSGALGNLPPCFAHVPTLSKPFALEDMLARVEDATHHLLPF